MWRIKEMIPKFAIVFGITKNKHLRDGGCTTRPTRLEW